jgi:hypothetical protein
MSSIGGPLESALRGLLILGITNFFAPHSKSFALLSALG